MESITTQTTPTVSDVARAINASLREVGSGWVEGEVRSIVEARSGHVYLTLADEDASIDACVWKGRRHACEPLPVQGGLARAHFERVDFYAPRGATKLIIDRIKPTGEGELLRRRAEVLRRLQAEGLCDPRRRLNLPRFPRSVGVIAAQDAKIDVLRHLQDRFPPIDIVFCAATIQGVEAVGSMIDSLGRLQDVDGVDVIVVARGGGSVTDMVPFDDERLCRAIATSEVPVVTSIGHTKDRPNCDFVAAAAATVPAKAAELALPHAAAELTEELARHALVLASVPGRIEIRRHSVVEIWNMIRLRRRLTEKLSNVDLAGELLDSRATAEFKHRVGILADLARNLDVRARQLTRPDRLDDLRQRLRDTALVCLNEHRLALDVQKAALRTAGHSIPRPASLDV